jgi:nicotinate-nucleotide pyrophosphorylase (carboxylating)
MNKEIENIIRTALEEDIGSGDITTLAIIPADINFQAEFIAKEAGIIAGWGLVKGTFNIFPDPAELTVFVPDGNAVEKGQVIATIKGSARTILSGERVALNFLQRMSGIATLTRRFVNAVKGSGAVILDTRKTAPGLRLTDKLAVKAGGGENHRFGLYDMVLIKENHITVAGTITEAVKRVREKSGSLPVEVEVKNFSELEEALKLKVDRILLDNMSVAEMKQAVLTVNGLAPLEASGNITIENVAEVAGTGVNFISTGQLTHSVTALDISLLITPLKGPL